MNDWRRKILADPEMEDCRLGASYLFNHEVCRSAKSVSLLTKEQLRSFTCSKAFLKVVFAFSTFENDEKREEHYRYYQIKATNRYSLPTGIRQEIKRIVEYLRKDESQAGHCAKTEYECDRPETKIKTEHSNIEPQECHSLSIKLERSCLV